MTNDLETVYLPSHPSAVLRRGASYLSNQVRLLRRVDLDLRHGWEAMRSATASPAGRIVLAQRSDLSEALASLAETGSDSVDAFSVRALPDGGVLLSGNSDRAAMYAAYRLVDFLLLDKPLESIDETFVPRMEKRFNIAWYPQSGGWNVRQRFHLHMATLDQLPRYGVNGLILANSPTWPWFAMEVKDGRAGEVELETAELEMYFDRLKSYGMEVGYTCRMDFPPQYTQDQVNDYLAGRLELPNYLDDYRAYHTLLLEAFAERFPQVDYLVGNMAEGTMGWGFKRQVSHLASTLFLDHRHGHDLDRCAEVFDAYLSTLESVCRTKGRSPLYWSHNCGPSNHGIRRMREVFEKHPGVTIIEEDRWNNIGWMNLPILGYLPEDLQQAFFDRDRKAMMIISDGEFLGGGAFPTCVPEPQREAAEFAIDAGVQMFIARTDLHERTDLGTLFGLNAVNFKAAMDGLWEPAQPVEAVWEDWLRMRFGKAAAAGLKPVLQSARSIIERGILMAGLPLVKGSQLRCEPYYEGPPKVKSCYDVYLRLRRPGTPVIPEDQETLGPGDFMTWQLNAKSVPIAEVRADQAQAMELVERGLERIAELQPALADADYIHLMRVFSSTRLILRAFEPCLEAVYFGNLIEDNYDGVDDPHGAFRQAIAAIRQRADKLELECETPLVFTDYRDVPVQMRLIAEGLEARVLQSQAR